MQAILSLKSPTLLWFTLHRLLYDQNYSWLYKFHGYHAKNSNTSTTIYPTCDEAHELKICVLSCNWYFWLLEIVWCEKLTWPIFWFNYYLNGLNFDIFIWFQHCFTFTFLILFDIAHAYSLLIVRYENNVKYPCNTVIIIDICNFNIFFSIGISYGFAKRFCKEKTICFNLASKANLTSYISRQKPK